MEYSAIEYKKENGVATITICRPESMNCLVQAVLDELAAVTKEIAADAEVKAVILTGKGRAFCAGGDLNRFVEGFTPQSAIEYVDLLHPWCMDWINLKKPTIAAVNGAAVGAGMSIALMCDITIASEQAKLGSAFLNMGLIPDLSATYFLPRMVGVHRAKELMLTGRTFGAEEALQMGVVDRVVPQDALLDEARKLAAAFAAGPTYAIASTKRMLNASMDLDLNSLLNLESILQSTCFMTDDSKEAVNAFLEKRKPVFTGK